MSDRITQLERQLAEARAIIRELVNACSGEVEEVFRGEIGCELDRARAAIQGEPA